MQDHLLPYLLEVANKGSALESEFYKELLEETLEDMRSHLTRIPVKDAARSLISTQNYMRRSSLKNHECVMAGIGDVCFIDFGQAYLNEAGFQHFGLILSVMNGKVFVVPMTSNPETYRNAYDPSENPKGKTHLMRFGQICGLNRPSVLFLNDCKFISPSRIIEVKGRLDPHSELFRRIQARVARCLFKRVK